MATKSKTTEKRRYIRRNLDPNDKQMSLDIIEVNNLNEIPKLKDDQTTMEFPFFSLSRRKDTDIREYKQGNKRLTITCNAAFGHPTQEDKDLFIYFTSVIGNDPEIRKQLLSTRTINVKLSDYVYVTGQTKGGRNAVRFLNTLRRLSGVNIEAQNIIDGEAEIHSLRMIEEFKVKIHNLSGDGALEANITLTKWFVDQLLQGEKILSLNQDYFKIASPILKRIYELVRKHQGHQVLWICDLDRFRLKVGTRMELRFFRREIKKFVKMQKPKEGVIPEYYLAFDEARDQLVTYTNNFPAFWTYVTENRKFDWFARLYRMDTQTETTDVEPVEEKKTPKKKTAE